MKIRNVLAKSDPGLPQPGEQNWFDGKENWQPNVLMFFVYKNDHLGKPSSHLNFKDIICNVSTFYFENQNHSDKEIELALLKGYKNILIWTR